MATERQGWINLDECIYSYLSESEQSNNKYYKCFQLAFRAMTDLGLDFFYQIKTVKIPVSSTLTVSLPSDCINYTKIGVFNSLGEVIPLTFNNKISLFSDSLPTRLQQTQDNTIFDLINFNSPIWYNYWNDGTFLNIYGLPSGSPFVGSFNIDIHEGLIVLSENFGYNYLLIEYVASPKQGETYYVPIHFKESIIAFLRWKDILSLPNSRKSNLGEKQLRRKEYYNERRLAIARYRPFYLSDAYEWNLENQRKSVKS
jgi:hypothetical protein